MEKNTDIGKLSKRYVRQGLSIMFGLFLISLMIINVWHLEMLLIPLVVSTVFSTVVDVTDALVWRKIASSHPQSLPVFYSAVSGFRMLLALIVMLVYYLTVGSDSMLVFFLVFVTFYLVLLLHHSIFFSRVSNSTDKLKKV